MEKHISNNYHQNSCGSHKMAFIHLVGMEQEFVQWQYNYLRILYTSKTREYLKLDCYIKNSCISTFYTYHSKKNPFYHYLQYMLLYLSKLIDVCPCQLLYKNLLFRNLYNLHQLFYKCKKNICNDVQLRDVFLHNHSWLK